jgi:hypothetical protein
MLEIFMGRISMWEIVNLSLDHGLTLYQMQCRLLRHPVVVYESVMKSGQRIGFPYLISSLPLSTELFSKVARKDWRPSILIPECAEQIAICQGNRLPCVPFLY